eukprot:TRINITY_DN41388_c0_g3_i1.p3 TRINITY_DN41388_c0_g3~~TRINITY_DN41388_c0_g3_i1.p3  ORF type:complete len:105 (+),score=28.25 TRINITY_DN41388_c0_g3_i1:405-719(+)
MTELVAMATDEAPTPTEYRTMFAKMRKKLVAAIEIVARSKKLNNKYADDRDDDHATLRRRGHSRAYHTEKQICLKENVSDEERRRRCSQEAKLALDKRVGVDLH